MDTSLIRNSPPPLGPPYGPRHNPIVGSQKGTFFHDRRNPVDCVVGAFYLVPYFLHFEPCIDALRLRSNVIGSIKILSFWFWVSVFGYDFQLSSFGFGVNRKFGVEG